MNQPNLALAKKLNIAAIIVSIAVIALVIIMGIPAFKIQTDIDFSFLPPIYSSMNALCAMFLIIAFIQIKKKNIEAHKKANFAALVCSGLFLVGYVLYHFTTGHTSFGGQGWVRKVYFFLLNTHIALAGLSLPFILFTFIRAYTGQIEKHRKMAKWVFPIWLYVAITGPIIYLMIRPYYGI